MGTGGALNPPPGEIYTGGGLSSSGKGDVACLCLDPEIVFLVISSICTFILFCSMIMCAQRSADT